MCPSLQLLQRSRKLLRPRRKKRTRHRSSLLEDDNGKVIYISGFAEPLLQIFLELGDSNRYKTNDTKKKKNEKRKGRNKKWIDERIRRMQ